jgi:hypothetical protein
VHPLHVRERELLAVLLRRHGYRDIVQVNLSCLIHIFNSTVIHDGWPIDLIEYASADACATTT